MTSLQQKKMEHCQRYPHIAPEVIDGKARQSTYSDMFSFGSVLYKIVNNGCLLHTTEHGSNLKFLAENCCLENF